MRQAIDNFIHRLHTATQSEQTVTISLREESDKLVQIYNDGRYSLDDLAAILEDDVTILLREYKNESQGYERDKSNEYWKSVHESKLFLVSGLLMFIIDRAASARVFLSDDYLREYEDDKFLNTTFADYVRNEYKGKRPQHKAPKAPQKPNDGNDGELAGNGNETRPEPTAKPIVKEQLPTIYDDEVNKAREQYVFYKAIQRGWMELKGNTYEWKRNQFYLALMCGLLYWGDKVTDDLGANTDSLGEYPKILSKSTHRFKWRGKICKTSKDIKALFGGANVSNLRSQLIELSQVEDEYESILRLFPTD